MVFPEQWWIPVAASLILSAVGFYRFVWFLSVGYGFAVSGIGLTMLVMALAKGQCSVLYALQCILFIVYGIRLGGFLFLRELKNASYRAKAKQVGSEVNPPVFVSVVVWVCCGFLYVMQSAGLVYRFYNGNAASPNAFAWAGFAIGLAGFLLETVADKQKSAQKKLRPDMPAMKGLYKLCRCPNYFGEMVFWTGAVISGIGSLKGWQWLVAGIGYIAIIGIMLSGGKRVEGRHIKNYGSSEEYRKYADTVPLLFPFLPLYHMTTPEKLAREEAAKKAKVAKKKG